MFTGIIEEVGTVDRIAIGAESAVLTISADKVLEGTKLGDSIAVNGVCLTVTSLQGDRFQADVMAVAAGLIWNGRWLQADALAVIS